MKRIFVSGVFLLGLLIGYSLSWLQTLQESANITASAVEKDLLANPSSLNYPLEHNGFCEEPLTNWKSITIFISKDYGKDTLIQLGPCGAKVINSHVTLPEWASEVANFLSKSSESAACVIKDWPSENVIHHYCDDFSQ